MIMVNDIGCAVGGVATGRSRRCGSGRSRVEIDGWIIEAIVRFGYIEKIIGGRMIWGH